jgi:hypothetical protein
MSIILKLAAAALIGYFGFFALTAEVLKPPEGKTQEEFEREIGAAGRNVIVVKPDKDINSVTRTKNFAATSILMISAALIYWAFADWRRRKRMSVPRDPQKFIEWTVSDDDLVNNRSYGWPLRCAWSGWGDNRIKAEDCDGIVLVCQMRNKKSGVRREANKITAWQTAKRLEVAVALQICKDTSIFFS